MNRLEESVRPEFFCFHGGGITPNLWAFGYWTGPEADLICLLPNIETNEECESHLCPCTDTPEEAVRAFTVYNGLGPSS